MSGSLEARDALEFNTGLADMRPNFGPPARSNGTLGLSNVYRPFVNGQRRLLDRLRYAGMGMYEPTQLRGCTLQ